MKKNNIYHLYRINWIDAHSNGGWDKPKDVNINPLKVHSVGWLIKESPTYFVLAQNMSSNGNCADRIHIPKKWITSKHKITGNIIDYDT